MWCNCANILESVICTSLKLRFTVIVVKEQLFNFLTILILHYSLMSNRDFQDGILHDLSEASS